jgi:hypothetical protein
MRLRRMMRRHGLREARVKTRILVSILSTVLLASPYAFAQQPSDPSASTPPAPATSDPPAAASTPPPAPQAPANPEAAPADGGRFRFGINPTAGLETVSASGASISGAMFGLDMRFGWQFNHILAVYGQPHLSFGSLGTTTAGGVPISGFTGTFVGTVMAEATFIDRLFVGGGFGYGVLNNPSGIAIEGRIGGYPIMVRGANGIRRKGLMIGGDVRAVFVDGATGTLLMGCLGYEAF